MAVRLLPAQVQLSQDGQAHEEPVAEAVVVDELKHVLHRQVDQRHDTLRTTQDQERRQRLKRFVFLCRFTTQEMKQLFRSR